jgi:dynactin 6
MSSKRHSMMPSAALAGPKAPVNFSSSVTIAESAIVTGAYPVTISSESVIHPRARLDSTGGPVNIGRRCIVHERTHVGAGADADTEAEGSVTLGDCVTVEVGAVVETGGTTVGEGTIIGVGCRVGRGASVGKVRSPRTIKGYGSSHC